MNSTLFRVKKNFLLIFTTLFLFSTVCSATDIVRYATGKNGQDPKEQYFIDVLKLALEETKSEFGDYKIEAVPLEMSQGRSSIMIERDQVINLTWRMTSIDLEKRLLAVYVPLLRGMMGYRIFIIKKNQQALFSKDITRKKLQQLLAGQGYEWQDNVILQHNNFSLVEGAAPNLIAMLHKQRFDYFPRALHEAWVEVPQLGEDLKVEENILLKYNSPVYFFVNKQNYKLAKRLSIGLNKIVDSGQLQHLLTKHPVTKDAIKLSNLSNRAVFELANPFVSEETEQIIDNDKYWLELNN